MSEKRLFVKKPIPCPASQWFKAGDHPEVACPPPHCTQSSDMRCEKCGHPSGKHGWIKTLEGGSGGAQLVCVGDWIMEGIAGEFYPIKPAIFSSTYQSADTSRLGVEPELAHMVHRAEQENASLRAQLAAQTEKLDELKELQATFDMRWEADMRAIKRWQAAHPGNDLVWPDHVDLVMWLAEQLAGLKEYGKDCRQRMLEVGKRADDRVKEMEARERAQLAEVTHERDHFRHSYGAKLEEIKQLLETLERLQSDHAIMKQNYDAAQEQITRKNEQLAAQKQEIARLLEGLRVCVDKLDERARKQFPQLGITDSRYKETWQALDLIRGGKE